MKKYLKYIFFFFLFLMSLLYFYIPFRMDTYANYGFSYGIANSQIPYKEFNIIVPLFSPFLYSIFLIFSKSILIYYIEQSILLVIFSYFLFKLLDKKAWIIITALFCPYIFNFPFCLFPGYNFIILFELLLLLYLNLNNKSDKLIGLIAGISFLTKQNIGIFILLVSIFYPLFKDRKKSFTRFIFSMIPILIFTIYLFLSNSFFEFINLCFLNMHEFTGNFQFKTMYFILLLITILIVLVIFIKSKNKNISYYYLLAYFPIVYPLIESHHVSLFIFFALIVIVYNIKINISKSMPIIFIIVIFSFIISYNYFSKYHYERINFYSFHNFPLEVATPTLKKDYDEIIKFVPNKKVIYVGDPYHTIFFTSTTETDLNKYYILFRGNHGYNGEQKLIKNIKQEKDVYFIVSKFIKCEDKSCQFYKHIPELIKNNYKLIKDLKHFSIYYKE